MTGYCYGGSVTWASACRTERLAAASCYYGSMMPKLANETPKCLTIVHLGETDVEIPLEPMQAVAARCSNVKLHIYPAGHGFNSDRRTDYHHDSAMLARERTLALFARGRRRRGGA
jgi:carboxymethylenebutenolidase